MSLADFMAGCPIKRLVPGKDVLVRPMACFESSEGQIRGVFFPFMLHQTRREGTLLCAGIPSMFFSQEIVGSILCQFKITRQMLFLAQ